MKNKIQTLKVKRGGISRPARCICGGVIRRVTLKEFDFTPLAGVPALLENVPGLRCDRCKGETLMGDVISEALRSIAYVMIESPDRATADEARYLRRTLQNTQQELADRMGIARETVAQWERGASEISPQHDLILKTITLREVFGDPVLTKPHVQQLLEALASLSSVKASPPPKRTVTRRVDASSFGQAAHA